MLRTVKKIIPRSVFSFFQPAYHWCLTTLGAIIYRFPARRLTVICVTGTKGKTTTIEYVNAVLVAAGFSTAVISTLRFKIGATSSRNMFKMTMPGRMFIQKSLREAVDAGCTHAIIETTSEGAKLFRHAWLFPDALIVTNIAPEHIESHGSYDNYVAAKLSIAQELESSPKPHRALFINTTNPEKEKFLALNIPIKIEYSREHARREGVSISMLGDFNLENAAAAHALGIHFHIPLETIRTAIVSVREVQGRMQPVTIDQPVPFEVIVDYAHTPDSLEAAYGAFPQNKKICVLGGTGGGRDTWKRPVMGEIATRYCDEIILTDEDPYDEDPRQIVDAIARGISGKKYTIMMDRREAISTAVHHARAGDVVLITGKGTDPYIMGANGTKTPWSDSDEARAALEQRYATNHTH